MDLSVLSSNIMLTLVFTAAVLAVYYLLPVNRRWAVLPVSSLAFYWAVSPDMLLMVLASVWWTWRCGVMISGGREKRKKIWLAAGVIPAVGVLFAFKYFNFFAESFAAFFASLGMPVSAPVLKLALPVGLSYYTFKMISYMADVYRGKYDAERSLRGYYDYMTYVMFFPQILSGPIQRYDSFRDGLKSLRRFDSALFSRGLQLIVLGLFKKMVIANRLTDYVDAIFGAPTEYPAAAAWLAAVLYSFLIYCDFSGYSDIAIGMGDLLGIDCGKNFDCPYFSRGIKEFWSRWHISLSGWLRDYVYIPLGGSRVNAPRRAFNLMVTFLVSGLWHGASWTFVVWGGIHGVWSVFASKKDAAVSLARRVWQTLVTFAGVTVAWVFFRAESIGEAFIYLRHAVADFSLSYAVIQNSILPFTGDNTCAAYFITVCLFIVLLFFYERGRVYGRGDRAEVLSAPWLAVMLLSVIFFGVFKASGFLYAGF